MTTYSENYSFALPEDEDGYDIAPVSENFETLDSILAENEAQAAEINAKIGTPAESGQTLFSLLGNGGGTGLTAIKSIQYITENLIDSSGTCAVAINTVVPENCIGLFELLYYTSGITNPPMIPKTLYKINADNVTFTFGEGGYFNAIVGLWIIEFC